MYKGHLEALKVTADEFRVTAASIMSTSRKKSVARARHALCEVLSEYYGLSSVEIGDIIKRDHTTVLNSLEKSSVLKIMEPAFRSALKASLRRLKMKRLAACSPVDTLTGNCMGYGSVCITEPQQ